MSRSGYSEDLDNWALIRWRGAVASAIKGKKGQALLKEMEASLLVLPEKRLCVGWTNPKDGEVCALGSVALKRKMDAGKHRVDAMAEIEREFHEDVAASEVSGEFNIADALAQEITYVNDERGPYDCTPEERYEFVLGWVRDNIHKD
jgi:hypothetical protein